MRYIILPLVTVFILALTSVAIADTANVKVFGASVESMSVQYVDDKGSLVTNKKDEEDIPYCWEYEYPCCLLWM